MPYDDVKKKGIKKKKRRKKNLFFALFKLNLSLDSRVTPV
jgi:hypothetical protein